MHISLSCSLNLSICVSSSLLHTFPHVHTHKYIPHVPPSPSYCTTTPLTLADVLVLLESRFAHTPPDRNQPASICTAVHLGGLKLFRGIDTDAVDFHQRRVPACYRVGELGQVEHSEGTLLVEDPYRDQSDTGAQVLEGQVEALFTQVADVAHLRVQLHDAVPNIHLMAKDISHVLANFATFKLNRNVPLCFSPKMQIIYFL